MQTWRELPQGEIHHRRRSRRGGSFLSTGDSCVSSEIFLFILKSCLAADGGVPQAGPLVYLPYLVHSRPTFALHDMLSMGHKEGCVL